MAGNAMVFTKQTKDGRGVTLRMEEYGGELCVLLNAQAAGGVIQVTFSWIPEEEEAVMRFLIERCNARRSVPA